VFTIQKTALTCCFCIIEADEEADYASHKQPKPNEIKVGNVLSKSSALMRVEVQKEEQ
jgi:hypothetical protein